MSGDDHLKRALKNLAQEGANLAGNTKQGLAPKLGAMDTYVIRAIPEIKAVQDSGERRDLSRMFLKELADSALRAVLVEAETPAVDLINRALATIPEQLSNHEGSLRLITYSAFIGRFKAQFEASIRIDPSETLVVLLWGPTGEGGLCRRLEMALSEIVDPALNPTPQRQDPRLTLQALINTLATTSGEDQAEAADQVAFHYRHGQGVSKNYIQSQEWSELAEGMGRTGKKGRLEEALETLRSELGATPSLLSPDDEIPQLQPARHQITDPVEGFRAGLALDLRGALVKRFKAIEESAEVHTLEIRRQVEILLEGLEREIAEERHQLASLETGDREACIMEMSLQQGRLETLVKSLNTLA
jgi:hypothetical protein